MGADILKSHMTWSETKSAEPFSAGADIKCFSGNHLPFPHSHSIKNLFFWVNKAKALLLINLLKDWMEFGTQTTSTKQQNHKLPFHANVALWSDGDIVSVKFPPRDVTNLSYLWGKKLIYKKNTAANLNNSHLDKTLTCSGIAIVLLPTQKAPLTWPQIPGVFVAPIFAVFPCCRHRSASPVACQLSTARSERRSFMIQRRIDAKLLRRQMTRDIFHSISTWLKSRSIYLLQKFSLLLRRRFNNPFF